MITQQHAGRIADDIVDRLFSSGSVRGPATRLELKKDDPLRAGMEIALGGWCKRAVRDQVLHVIRQEIGVQP